MIKWLVIKPDQVYLLRVARYQEEEKCLMKEPMNSLVSSSSHKVERGNLLHHGLTSDHPLTFLDST